MKKLFRGIGALVALVAGGSAMAADLPVKAPIFRAPAAAVYDWTGFYVGAHAGYAWARTNYSDPLTGDQVPLAAKGFIGGGQAGYNWQTGPWVFGVEGQGSWSHLQDGKDFIIVVITAIRVEVDCVNKSASREGPAVQSTIIVPVTIVAIVCRKGSTVENLGSVAGRIGYAWDRLLGYVKGGPAWAQNTFRIFDRTGGAATLIAETSNTRWGWMVGGGFEYALTTNWSTKVEYNYMDFGTDRTIFTPLAGGASFAEDIRQNISLVKLGINYRFGGPVIARY